MVLLDNSAWQRLGAPGLSESTLERLAGELEDGLLATCLPFLLEAGYSARSAEDHAQVMGDLRLLPQVAVDDEAAELAIDAQGTLALHGHHRVPPTDLVIAACAHRAGTGVLHYDRHFDLIAEHTALEFESRWLAPAGSL